MSGPQVPAILYWIEPYKDLKYDHEKCVVTCVCCGVDLTQLKHTFILKHVNSILHQTKCRQTSSFIQSWIEPYHELRYNADQAVILCTLCDISITLKKDNVLKHVNSTRHQQRSGNTNDFHVDLCMFLITCNIPWNRLNHPEFRKFMEKYLCCKCSKRKLPDESTLRKHYLQKVYTSVINEIRTILNDCYLWLSVEETLDNAGNCVTNVIVKSLQGFPCRPYLLSGKVLEKVNGISIAELVENTLIFLWQDDFETNICKFLVFCTDSAAYMLIAGKILKKKFYNMKHVTCLAHALNRVAEQIRSEHNEVDKLISNVKMVFDKSPPRTRLFKAMAPDVLLPPQPSITKWGMWLSAAFYYANHYEIIKNIIFSLNSGDAVAILNAQTALSNVNMSNELSFIKDNYKVIVESITKLQCTNISIKQGFQILDNIRQYLTIFGPETVKNKLEQELNRNPDYIEIRQMASTEQFEQVLQYTTLTAVDVERAFSSHKWIFNQYRTCFTPENMEKVSIIYSFYNCKFEMDNTRTIPCQDIEAFIPVSTCPMDIKN